jgi:hypothetical protein
MMGEENAELPDRATRWRQFIGPFFRDVWPLDVALRSEETTRNLVMMALECAAVFPEAVDAILDLVVPYRLYQIAHSLRLQKEHDELVREHPLLRPAYQRPHRSGGLSPPQRPCNVPPRLCQRKSCRYK